MPWITTPKWAARLEELIHILRYLTLIGAGIVTAYAAVRPALGVSGWVLIITAAVALVGVITRRFQLELVSLWFIMGAVAIASSVLYGIEAYTTGTLIIALLPMLAERLLYLTLIARKERAKAWSLGQR